MNPRPTSRSRQIGELWCGLMHSSPMWPIHGHYECRTCGRRYAVAWSGSDAAGSPEESRHFRMPTMRSALLPLLLAAAAILVPALRGSELPGDSLDGAAAAFARYTAVQPEAGPWRQETIVIDAYLPKLARQGRLSAVRRLLPFGRPQYQVLESTGDHMVKQQVIARYLSEDERASQLPPSSFAITPANYRFHYKGPVQTAAGIAYVFAITPLHKREGLIKGELWLDGETGLAVRQSGYLVKKPSLFVKHVEITREIAIANGAAETRTTHISIATRIAGPAELTIEERPVESQDAGDSDRP
jgi:hypothetical protein